MKLILLGAPGAGKGTQGEIISKTFDIPTISTGNILREAIKNKTELGKLAKEYIDKGNLVPDAIIMEVLNERLNLPDCKKGFILDGVPRTIAQAEAFDKMGIHFTKVISIEVSDEKIIERMGGRRVCPNCADTFHIVSKKPKVENICDTCGAELITREDDKPETVSQRLSVYHVKTEPLLEFYKAKGILVQVKNVEGIEEMSKAVLAALGAY